MSFLDTLFIDGTSVRALTGADLVGEIEGLFAPGTRRGDDDAPGGRDGELGAELPLAKYIIRFVLQISGATRGERNDNLFTVGGLIGGAAGNGLVQLKRRRATGSGSSYVEGLAQGRYITGLDLSRFNHLTGRIDVQYYNLSGGWNDNGSGVHTYP